MLCFIHLLIHFLQLNSFWHHGFSFTCTTSHSCTSTYGLVPFTHFFRACFYGCMLAHGFGLVLSFTDSCSFMDSPHSCALSVGFVHFHLPFIHVLSLRLDLPCPLSQSRLSVHRLTMMDLGFFHLWVWSNRVGGLINGSHLQLSVIIGNRINRFVSITTKKSHSLRKYMVIYSNQKYGRLPSITIDTINDNCMKSITIYGAYAIINIFVIINFE